MNKFFVYAIMMVFLVSFGACSVLSKTEEVKSTQGLEKIEQINPRKLKKVSKQEDNAYRLKQKNKKKYAKDVFKIKKLKEKQRKKERDLEFYQKRLNIKRDKLKDFDPSNKEEVSNSPSGEKSAEKGENE